MCPAVSRPPPASCWALAGPDGLSAEGVARVMEVLGDTGLSRVLVTGPSGEVLYDSDPVGNTLGRYRRDRHRGTLLVFCSSNFDGPPLSLDPDMRSVWRDGEAVELTAKEFDLMELLLLNPGRVYSRENLLNIVWGYEGPGSEGRPA